MSSKTKTTATKEEATPALVPKLRFPEFRRAEGWKPSVLAAACDMQAGKFVSASNISGRNQAGMFPCYGGNGLRGYTTTHTHDGTYPLIGRQGALCGNVRLASGQFHATEHAVVATPKKAIDVVWLCYSLDLLNLNRFATGQAQPGLSVDVLEKVALAIPPLEPEQQKIAECLSSVDELMAAQARKVDALKTHKKGLMQQLFPREGETQPRLRFPEFQNAGEWLAKPLGEIFPITSSKRVHESDWTATGVPFYRAREIVALNKQEPIQPLFISEELYSEFSKLTGEIREGHLLVTGVGSIGVPYLVKKGDRFYFKDGNIIWLKNDEKELSGEFLLRLYETDYVQKQLKTMADVGTVATYTIDNAKRTLAVYPPDPDEQQRIADCLTSLDDLIAAQTQKHEALKTHKKGLMQQLFPSPEEILV